MSLWMRHLLSPNSTTLTPFIPFKGIYIKKGKIGRTVLPWQGQELSLNHGRLQLWCHRQKCQVLVSVLGAHEQSSLQATSLVLDHSLEDTPKVRSSTIPDFDDNIDVSVGYKLPDRHNRDKPPSRYSVDVKEQKSKYLIANYVSTGRLSKPLKAFASNVSTTRVPNGVQEALRDSKWVQAMKDEMEALQKITLGDLWSCQRGREQ